ncbi:21107_t:CDS:2 [Gigaspora margarita]|uniref:21107_t:CDS:1 n=1 Tax=Gigaspora margarita TaxID=4874 RepID=A0ABN7V0X6_GIGMA|nr:21107_t:CDS:2 [Gigaspora margarita]
MAKTFEQSQEKIIKIQENALLLFGFKSRAKGTPDLKTIVKLINAIVGNWCGYTVKTYNGCGFNNQEEVITTKLCNPEYHPIALILPLYKPELADETQELFDLIPITTDIAISEFVEHGVTYLSSNTINEKALSLEIPAHNQTINSSQNIYHANTICKVSTGKKKIPNSLISLFSEFFIKNESDIDILIFLLQQKFQISQEKLEQ